MEFVFYAVIFIVVVTLVANFIQTLVYPPVEISIDELPPIAQQELDSLFPAFVPNQIRHLRPRHRYTLTGSMAETRCRLTFDLTPDGELAELEFQDDSGSKVFTNKMPIPTTAVPLRIADLMNPYLVEEKPSPGTSRAFSGMIGTENAYRIEIYSDEYEYEFVITESGRLVEFEKENLSY